MSFSQPYEDPVLLGKLFIQLLSVITNPGGTSLVYDLSNQYNEIVGEMSIRVSYQKEEHVDNHKEVKEILSPTMISPCKKASLKENIKPSVESTCLKVYFEEGKRISAGQQLNSFVELEFPFNPLKPLNECETCYNKAIQSEISFVIPLWK